MEWALVNYNGEFFPNPSTICQNIERKREADYHEQANREWPAWRATQAQAEREGLLATEEQYAELREKFRNIAQGPAVIKRGEHKSVIGQDDRSGAESRIGADVEKPVSQ